MAASIITTEDLTDFKRELLDDFKEIIDNHSGFKARKWLKSNEVKTLLGISPGTLQNLRINGTLPYTKIGGIIYYDYEEIQDILESNRVDNKYLKN